MKHPLLLLAAAAALSPSPAGAQPKVEPPPPTVILIRPAGEPTPALEYRLLPDRRELVPGNAAVFYHRAILMVLQTRAGLQGRDRAEGGRKPTSPDERIVRWTTAPLREISRDEARKEIEPYANALHEVELGARRTSCDWEFDLRDEGFELPLPEIQEMRSLSRLVLLRARLAVLDGRTDEAVHWFATGYAMSRHIGQGPTIVQTLVGVASAFIMSRGLEDLIQAPGTPSLYWALANLPRPFIDMAAAIEGDRAQMQRELRLRDVAGGVWSLPEARRFSDELQRKLAFLNSRPTPRPAEGAGPPSLEGAAARMTMAAMVVKAYPEARRRLIARGRPAAEVEAMPMVQVALLDTIHELDRATDDAYKWLRLPYPRSYRGAGGSIARTHDTARVGNPLLGWFLGLIPAVNNARLASVRLDRQLDLLQAIEAIRLDAAGHGGVLPASLETIAEAPVPDDPATGKPFEYRRGESSATLEGPFPPGGPSIPAYMIRYELKLAR